MIHPTKTSDITRGWHLIDATDQILGRLSTKVAALLIGKTKPYFCRNLDCGDHVVITNAEKIKVSGRKETLKIYQSYSGYPGGQRRQTLSEMRQKYPARILEHAIAGMLPDNKLKPEWLGRLHLFAKDNHNYADKFKLAKPDNSPKPLKTSKATKNVKLVKPKK